MDHNKPYMGGVCLVTDRCSCALTPVEMASLALSSGVRCIQYRDKEKHRLSLFRTALRLRDLTADFNAYLIVNDFADIAAAVEADGVHLGQDDMPVGEARKLLGGKIIGVSTHGIRQALKAQAEGADYVGFGPVMPTSTKDAGPAKGTEMLKKIKDRLNIPVMAIGGIDLDNLDSVLSSGAGAVAVASGILEGDICRNAGRFVKKLKACRR